MKHPNCRRRRKETLTSSFRDNESPYVVSYNLLNALYRRSADFCFLLSAFSDHTDY